MAKQGSENGYCWGIIQKKERKARNETAMSYNYSQNAVKSKLFSTSKSQRMCKSKGTPEMRKGEIGSDIQPGGLAPEQGELGERTFCNQPQTKRTGLPQANLEEKKDYQNTR